PDATTNRIQPSRNAQRSPYAARMYAYSPPAFGSIPPSSANVNAPASDMIPATSHASITIPGEPICCAMIAALKNTPVPIIEPTTSDVVPVRSSPRISSRFGNVALGAAILVIVQYHRFGGN